MQERNNLLSFTFDQHIGHFFAQQLSRKKVNWHKTSAVLQRFADCSVSDLQPPNQTLPMNEETCTSGSVVKRESTDGFIDLCTP